MTLDDQCIDYRRQTIFVDLQRLSRTYNAQRHHQTDDRNCGFKAYLLLATQKWLTIVGPEAGRPIVPLVFLLISAWQIGPGSQIRAVQVAATIPG